MDRPAIASIQSNQDQHDSSDEPHAKRQAQLLTWTNRRTRVTQACDRCRERKRQCGTTYLFGGGDNHLLQLLSLTPSPWLIDFRFYN